MFNQIANKKVIEISIYESNKYLNHKQAFSRKINTFKLRQNVCRLQPGNVSFFETQRPIESKELNLSRAHRANSIESEHHVAQK